MASRWARVVRGSAAAAVATLAAALSHSLAGGALSLVGLSLAGMFSMLVCIALAGRRLSSARLAASVLVSQLGYHALFSYIGGAAVHTLGHHGPLVIGADAHAMQMVTTAPMWAGHAIAALVTVVLLTRGAAALVRLVELVALLVLAAWRLPVVRVLPAARHRIRTGRVAAARLFLLQRSALRYRGPPAIRFA